ncbi:MAG TPA: hypothetical protein VKA21_15585 [Candidatus Binatia bacterium]|nr:hypothetical protein [Candidatus Binatia bacterium]
MTRRRPAGQAMVEYAIILAMTTGMAWVERLREVAVAEPLLAGLAVAGVLLAGYVLVRR